MEKFQTDRLRITLNRKGAGEYQKVSYPVRYGRFHEIETPAYRFQFNLNGEIKFIQGRGRNTLPLSEWLKRTVLNDWIYYSTGGYTGTHSFLGEYYLPNLCYASNTILGGEPFRQQEVRQAMTAWQDLAVELKSLSQSALPGEIKGFLRLVIENDVRNLRFKALEHQRIIQGRVTVLPPDARHSDYEVIPIVIADGCLHHCGFCRVKTRQDFKPRPRENILSQIEELKRFYGPDLVNYNSVFLGLHDALYADPDLILFAAEQAFSGFRLDESCVKGPRMFLFGSVDALLKAGHYLFEALDRLPYTTCINVGLESADPLTLERIKKPVAADLVVEGFEKMIQINRTYANIEVTANFILSERLSPNHYASLLELVRGRLDRYYSKGAIYLSPFKVREKNMALARFNELKKLSRLPTYLYVIQRL